MRNTLVASIFYLLFSQLSAQVEHARTLVEQLCSPTFHGRGYVNNGDSIAAEFVAKELKAANCQFLPSGPFQSFNFNVNTFPGKFVVSVNNQVLKPGVDVLVDPASSSANIINRQLIKIPITCFFEVRKLRSFVDSVQKLSLRSVVFIDVSLLKGDTLKKVKSTLPSLTETLPVLQIVDEKFTWSVADEQFKQPYLSIQKKSLGDVFPSTITIQIDAVYRKHTARNVLAYVPATKKSKKKPYVVFTAHYDHLGRMGQETYFPGGNDNASGTAMLLELARYYAAHPLKNVNVAFIAFAGEEAGLIGSKYYVEHPIIPLNKIKFLTNTDIMGSGEEGITVVNATLFPEAFQLLQDINEKGKYLTKIGSRGPAANSDHYFFSEAGVPAIFIYTMGPNKHYHDVLDTYEELSFSEFNDLFELLKQFVGDVVK